MKALEELFDIGKGHQLALNRIEVVPPSDSAIAYVARSHRNNGVTAWAAYDPDEEPAPAGAISVSLRSRNHALAAFVQPRPFYTTYHVAILRPKTAMSLQEKLWWCLCIRANRFRFNFGRQANRTIGSLTVPPGIPPWVSGVTIPGHAKSGIADASKRVSVKGWRAFLLADLFDLVPGRYTLRRELKPGVTPFVTASMWRNGVTAMVDVKADWPGGQITIAANGVGVGTAFYQPHPFAASRDVMVLNPKSDTMSASEALFVCTMLRQERGRFNYARKWTAGRMKHSTVLLPHQHGAPDFATMRTIMSNLRLGWVLEE